MYGKILIFTSMEKGKWIKRILSPWITVHLSRQEIEFGGLQMKIDMKERN